MSFSLSAGPRDDQWKAVEDALSKGLPQTAITNLQPIIAGALKDKAYPEAIKAIAKKITLEGSIQGDKPEEKITRLQAELLKAPKEMVPMLDTLLAHWYWQYFQQNRWRFMRRTATAQPPGKDFTTWDLPRLFAEIDRQFEKALQAHEILNTIPIAAWDALLVKGTMPDAYRPTLYDFVVHEALQFYSSGEQAAAAPEDAFELSAEKPIYGLVPLFGSADEFTAGKIERRAGESSAEKALFLFRDLLLFHRADKDPSAFADADLARLVWAHNSAFGDQKTALYKSALKVFVDKWADHELSALARHHWAEALKEEGELVQARALALRSAEVFPQSPGGKLCRNLVNGIEAKSATISTERVWNRFAGTPSNSAQLDNESARTNSAPLITTRYRNVTAVYFRAISYDWETFLEKRHNRPENLSDAERREILRRTPALEWSEQLPPATDYKEKPFSSPAPDKLKPGFYFIAASHDPRFSEQTNIVSLADVWVTDLALVTRQRDGALEGFVLEANSGEPISGAELSVWHLDNQGNRVADPTLTTDQNGLFTMKSSQPHGYLFRARYRGRELAAPGDVVAYGWQERQRPEAQTIFFTDRALYRPGQIIQFKGICLWVDRVKDNYEVLKGEDLTVIFKDANGKEIARQKQRANDYGSFSGSFSAPRDRLLGQMSLQVEGRAQGNAWFRVEEYKRPKFEVTLNSPGTGARLNEKVQLNGHAISYTGAAVDGAQVKFRVVREVQMPWWWAWYRGGGPHQGQSQEIAHGVARTQTDGSFQIEFVAKPDPKVPEKEEPTFTFKIDADVTESAGETRSASHLVRAGYSALEAMMSAGDWQTEDHPVELKLETRSLDGEPQVAEGTVKLYELQSPETVQRPPLTAPLYRRYGGEFGRDAGGDQDGAKDLSSPNNWPLGKVIAEAGFTSDTNGHAALSFKLKAGAYRAILETQDRFGKKVTGKLPLQVLNPAGNKLAIKIPHLVAAPNWEAQPGDEFMAVWGTGYDEGRAFIEIEHRRRMLQRFWTEPDRTQQQIKLAVTEAMRGGFTVHVTQVRENRAYLVSRHVAVPWKNKDLELQWEHFTSKLQPGQKETWTLKVQRPKSKVQDLEKAMAEMVAALYDESLDAFAPQHWMQRFNVFREDFSTVQTQFGNMPTVFQHVFGQWEQRPYQSAYITYRSFPAELTDINGLGLFKLQGRGMSSTRSSSALSLALEEPALAVDRFAAAPPSPTAEMKASKALTIRSGLPSSPTAEAQSASPKVDLTNITARKNLNETAFFFPQLLSDSNGIVRMTFAMPEALTRWRFMGFAHDRALSGGYLEGHTVTAKELMVQPNPPRFLREGDTLEFTVKVSNQSDATQTGKVRLNFNDAVSNLSADRPLGNTMTEQDFNIPPKESRGFSWRIQVPDGCGFLTYKAVAASATVSDGEEGALPVLPRRILVTESLPLPIRGPATKKFEFAKLLKSRGSKTLQNQNLTVQMVSNPAWYAVLALPYLMEFPHECSEQIFNRLYANALARNIALSDPKIRRIFDQWKNTPALESPLEKNQDLKNVALEETPWLRQAESESQARKNVGILFDENRLNYERDRAAQKLSEMQLPDGSWPWFPGGHGNDYITLYITAGFGRLRRLGVDINAAPAIRSLQRLDAFMTDHYNRIQKGPAPDKYVPSATDALYLYGRSFFLKDFAIAAGNKKAIDFFLTQARAFWLRTESRQTQAHLAIGLKRFNAFNAAADPTPANIMKSIKERSVSSEEMGMFWRDTESSWWWYRAPIETQALMIEAFDEVMSDLSAVENCRVWLLKQKQTQDWKTTKATADAVYALLLRGRDILASEALVEVTLGGKQIRKPNDEFRKDSRTSNPVEPGTGFYEVRFSPADITPGLGEITVKKVDAGVAWGSVHWQYLEDMSKVTPYEGTPLKLEKTLFTKVLTKRGPVLESVKGPLHIGDELVVRIELRSDRDMEYIHMKDQRGSGLEPLNVLSQYRYQDGLAYYESTRDTASHFFIDYLPKGVYVFEYSTRVTHKGAYQSGMTEIQCMYAPEFNSHSESILLSVK